MGDHSGDGLELKVDEENLLQSQFRFDFSGSSNCYAPAAKKLKAGEFSSDYCDHESKAPQDIPT